MMKYLNKIIVLLVLSLAFVACDENENFDILPAQESFQIITPSSGSVIVLNDDNLLNNALFLSWDSTSSMTDVTYSIEVAATGSDFETPVEIGSTQNNNFSMNVIDINTLLVETLNLNPNEATSLDVRVKAGEETTPTISIILTPTTIEFTELAIYGSFTDNWDKASALEMNNVGFNTYELIVELPENAEFQFFTTQKGLEGDLGNDAANEGSLIKNGANLTVVEANEYKINVDLNTMTFTIQLAVYPELFLVGDATAAGWDPSNNNFPMFKDPEQGGLYHYTGLFKAGNIKLIETRGNWQPQWGQGSNEGELAGNPGTQSDDPGTIPVSTEGYYTLTVDLVNLTYTFVPFDASAATTYSDIGVIGAATPTGWGSDTDMTQSTFDPHIWYMTLDMTESDGGDCDCGFKFRADNDWATAWGGVVNPPTENYGIATADGGKNIGVPETGTYTIFFNTLDFRYHYIIE